MDGRIPRRLLFRAFFLENDGVEKAALDLRSWQTAGKSFAFRLNRVVFAGVSQTFLRK